MKLGGGQVSWSKANRERAKSEGKTLYVFGYSNGAGGDAAEYVIAIGATDNEELLKELKALLGKHLRGELERQVG